MTKLKLTRRDFLRGMAAAPLLAVSATSLYASLIEPHSYHIIETNILVPELPAAFEGFRIAQITDVHHSRIVPIAEVHRVVEAAMKTKPDLIALTGDYTTSYRRYIEPCAEALGELSAPEGVWAVLGNHDHYTDPLLTVRALKRHRVSVLENANTAITRGGDTLQLLGIGDWTWGRADWARALHGVDKRRPSVMLSHQPVVLDLPEAEGVSLILSGHTHGGQVSLPLVGPPIRYGRDFKYVQGLYEKNGTQLYVSAGTGVIGLPVRLGVRPEISVLKLKRA
ncbi:MAG TPA: metallophosphoesterase [Pyrinomonadaceae bacterium]|nr:metallophosphoesterase [Pyrinomonadaceae bacterium]